MRLMLDGLLAFIIIAFSVILCAGFVNAEMQINEAKSFYNTSVAAIEHSDFSSSSINTAKTSATNRGYVLSVGAVETVRGYRCPVCSGVFPDTSKNAVSCPNGDHLNGKNMELLVDRRAKVKLTYKISINLIGYSKDGVLEGYAE